MILHTGTSWGYGALLTLVPDLNVAIHTSITGPDAGYRARRALHMYVIDLVSDFEPFLNASRACRFPDTKQSTGAVTLSDSPERYRTHHHYHNNSVYEGQYTNLVYGNLTVQTNETSGRLQIQYGALGLWNLYTTSEENTFAGKGVGHFWSSRIKGVVFSACDNDTHMFKKVRITSFEPKDSPVFERYLA